MTSVEPASGDPTQSKCRIAEIVQYTCAIQKTPHGRAAMHCFPVPRIFRICPYQPAVEITKFINIDLATGEVDISSSQNLPEGRPWKDILRYEQDDNGEQY